MKKTADTSGVRGFRDRKNPGMMVGPECGYAGRALKGHQHGVPEAGREERGLISENQVLSWVFVRPGYLPGFRPGFHRLSAHDS